MGSGYEIAEDIEGTLWGSATETLLLVFGPSPVMDKDAKPTKRTADDNFMEFDDYLGVLLLTMTF
ncbi:hypothetical protein N7475_009903 [Penicillium sp. IBT 31633x]|nr:hypothetical protein N7475_009903 [Penicillium sp. IBT 31633x]